VEASSRVLTLVGLTLIWYIPLYCRHSIRKMRTSPIRHSFCFYSNVIGCYIFPQYEILKDKQVLYNVKIIS
jgi:hypothetical protein